MGPGGQALSRVVFQNGVGTICPETQAEERPFLGRVPLPGSLGRILASPDPVSHVRAPPGGPACISSWHTCLLSCPFALYNMTPHETGEGRQVFFQGVPYHPSQEAGCLLSTCGIGRAALLGRREQVCGPWVALRCSVAVSLQWPPWEPGHPSGVFCVAHYSQFVTQKTDLKQSKQL